MHRTFRKLLDGASGTSELIVAIFIDVRGFSQWSKTVESPDTAMFIKRVYSRIVDEYFPSAAFFKPTGDGLLVIVKYDEKTLKTVVQSCVSSSMKLCADFKNFCKDDPMINFPVPPNIGVGLSRGTACRLSSGHKILDYSGRLLNLASRLNDLARPQGIVFDEALGFELLDDATKSKFRDVKVYVRGLAEQVPISVYFTSELTLISKTSQKPISEPSWEKVEHKITLAQLADIGASLALDLGKAPSDKAQVFATAKYPAIAKNGEKLVPGYQFEENLEFEVLTKGVLHSVRVKLGDMEARLRKAGMKDSQIISIIATFPVA
jgi:class 3 adenylate cyclase